MSCQLTQKDLILKHLRLRGSITTAIATDRYRCFRLSERIRELERDGHLINHARITRNGHMFVAYSLVEGKQQKRAA
jgi:hypothetical protein